MVLYLVAVASNVESSILSLVAGQLGFATKFFRMFVVFRRRFCKSFELFSNHLTLSLSRSSRGHGSIVADILKLEGLVKLFSTKNRLLFKVSMAQQVDCAVTEFARQRAKLMACLPILIAFSNNVSLNSLNHMQFSTDAHCVYNLKAHLIFVVAYRRKAISSRILQRILQRLIENFSHVYQCEQSELLECSGERDHVHLLISYPPKLCLSELIRKLKAISSLKIRREFNSEIRHLLLANASGPKVTASFLSATVLQLKSSDNTSGINDRTNIRSAAIHPRAHARGIPRHPLKRLTVNNEPSITILTSGFEVIDQMFRMFQQSSEPVGQNKD